MSTELISSNLAIYCMQVGLVVGLAAFVPAALRLRMPRARLAYWHILLIACLALPLIQPWRREVIAATVDVSTFITSVAPASPAAPRTIPRAQIALWILAAGAAARLVWLIAGCARLWLYRRRSTPLGCETPFRTRAEIRLSQDTTGPVTFGFFHPVVLVPPQFPALDRRAQSAILVHELLHVERGDWLFTVAEELVRVVFWFHPAIWWLLGEIQLTREQAVDRAVVDLTHAREEYVDALLAIAGANPRADLAPAPLFLRKRHLKQRVVSILKEARMSRTGLISSLAAGLGVLVAACWLVTATFPLSAAPQVVNDASGVSVDLRGAALLHRSPVNYPETARAKGVQGTVTLDVTLDSGGAVSDAQVLTGPEELRKAALQSVLQWHFAREAASTHRQVAIAFEIPPAGVRPAVIDSPLPSQTPGPARIYAAGATEEARKAAEERARAALARTEALVAELRTEAARRQDTTPRTLRKIEILGLADPQRAELLGKLPVHEGDQLTPALIERATQTVREFDEHLTINVSRTSDSESAIRIVAPNAPVPERIRVGGNVQQAALIKQPRPVYPQEAKDARISGVVKFQAIIGKDGAIQSLEVISGHPLLVSAALEAVKLWVYQPTLLNGSPVEVITQIDVNFTLSQ